MVPLTEKHLNSLYLSNSNSSEMLKLEPLASVLLVRGVILGEALVEIHRGLLLIRVLAVLMVVVDFRTPPQIPSQVLHPHHRQRQPLLGPRTQPNRRTQTKRTRRNM